MKKRQMKVNDWIHVVAGIFIVASVTLSVYHSKYWLLFTLFVGLNLFQYGFSGFCPMGVILKKCGVKPDGDGGSCGC